MKLGLVAMPLSTRERPLQQTYSEIRDRVVLADQLGYTEAFIGEHFSSANMPVASPLTIIAWLIDQTSQIRLGAGVLALPYHHPAIVASELAQLDHLSGGRLNVGVGPGGLLSDMELFGVLDTQARTERMMNSVDNILQLWQAEAPFQINGYQETFGIHEHVNPDLGIGSLLHPLQKPHPPIFVTAMSPRSASIRLSVRRGWAPISAQFCSDAVLRSHASQMHEAFEELEVEPKVEAWRISRHVVVRESDAEAEDAAHDPTGATHFAVDYFWRLLVAGGQSAVMKKDDSVADEDVRVDDLITQTVIHGSAETVTSKLAALHETLGSFGTLLLPVIDADDHGNAGERESMLRLARDVLPRVSN